MLDVLLDASLPESDVMYTLVDLFVAGVNTVSTTLEWVLLLTADQPHHQIRARADSLSRNSPDDRAADRNSSKGSSQGRPSYADALIRETLCYKPPLLLPRRSIVDTSVGTHRIPAGRIVLANSWALTRDRSWWESPTTFDRNAAGKKKTRPLRELNPANTSPFRSASGCAPVASSHKPNSPWPRTCC